MNYDEYASSAYSKANPEPTDDEQWQLLLSTHPTAQTHRSTYKADPYNQYDSTAGPSQVDAQQPMYRNHPSGDNFYLGDQSNTNSAYRSTTIQAGGCHSRQSRQPDHDYSFEVQINHPSRATANPPEMAPNPQHQNYSSYTVGLPQHRSVTQERRTHSEQKNSSFSPPSSTKPQSRRDHSEYDTQTARTKNTNQDKRLKDIQQRPALPTRTPTQRQNSGARIGSVYDPCNGENLQYICEQLGCEGQSFTRSADLQRHFLNKHAPAKPEYWCPIFGCDRSRSKGNAFPRKDKMMDHLRKKHPHYNEYQYAEEEDDAVGY